MPSRSVLMSLVRKLTYRHPLEKSDEAALLALPHRLKVMAAHEYIVREGDAPTQCCVMLSGFSIRHKIVGSGLRQILAIHMRGDVVDLQNSMLERADHNVQMLTQGEVAQIACGEIRRIALEHPRIGMAMWLDTLIDAAIFREWIANVGRRHAATRIAHVLCEFGLRLNLAGLGEPTNYELPMTQEQLADAVGLTPIHVNRTLKALEKEGLISRSNRAVTVGDWPRLASAGDFDPAYLHLSVEDRGIFKKAMVAA